MIVARLQFAFLLFVVAAVGGAILSAGAWAHDDGAIVLGLVVACVGLFGLFGMAAPRSRPQSSWGRSA